MVFAHTWARCGWRTGFRRAFHGDSGGAAGKQARPSFLKKEGLAFLLHRHGHTPTHWHSRSSRISRAQRQKEEPCSSSDTRHPLSSSARPNCWTTPSLPNSSAWTPSGSATISAMAAHRRTRAVLHGLARCAGSTHQPLADRHQRAHAYHPAIVAQAFAMLADMFPGRVALGIGSGESLNEVPATGMHWPEQKERTARLREAIRLIRTIPPVPATASGATFSDWRGRHSGFGGWVYRPQSPHFTMLSLPSAPPVHNARLSASRLGRGRGVVTVLCSPCGRNGRLAVAPPKLNDNRALAARVRNSGVKSFIASFFQKGRPSFS